MGDGELEFSNQEIFSNSNMNEIPPSGCSMDTFFDELLRDSHLCTHTHTCNPPGPDNTHTHTCYHVHTKILPLTDVEKVSTNDTAESSELKNKKRPLGNREAVRKYREKKKAKAASLQDEVIRLRAINQQLLKRIQSQAALEAEVARLKCLLVDLRGRIEGEIGAFPYQKAMNTSFTPSTIQYSYMLSPCNLQCDDTSYCPYNHGVGSTTMNGQGLNGCEFDQFQCLANQNSGSKDLSPCNIGSLPFDSNTSESNKITGGSCAARAG